MTYLQRIDRLTPGLVIVLVDQSDSMTETIADTGDGTPTTKAQAVADQINTLIEELIIRCKRSPREPPRAYFSVSVLGYSTDPRGEPVVESLLPGSRPDGTVSTTGLSENPLRWVRRTAPNGATITSALWVEPVGRGGTPMCAALRRAGRIAASWVAGHPDSFPPLIVNLSDGEATDGDPVLWAARLRKLSTSDGNLLLFNLNMSAHPGPVSLFPSDPAHLTDDYARALFRMSSPLPDPMVHIGQDQGLALRPGARGFAFNADLKTLAQFLNVGTSIGRAAR